MTRTTLLGLFLGLSLCSLLSAEDFSTADIRWGTHWSGPEIDSAKDLKGKVTLLKIWGG